MQEDAIENLASGGVQAEGDVREAEDRPCRGHLGLYPTNRLEGFDAVTTRVHHARRERQRQSVDEYVMGIEAVAFDREVGNGSRGAHFPLSGSRLPLFINAGCDDRSAELGGQGQEAIETSAG